MKPGSGLTFFLCLVWLSLPPFARAQSTAFSYPGPPTQHGSPTNGSDDFTFAVFNAASAGGQVGNRITRCGVSVSNDLFSVDLDFGAGVFPGPGRWLEIGVRGNGEANFTTLLPRPALTPVPYAIHAAEAGGVAG